MIRSPDLKLLVMGGSNIFKTSIPGVELRPTWTGIILQDSLAD